MNTKPKYRIVTDHYSGFEVQIKRWWFPFWIQCSGPFGPANTHSSIEKAEAFAKKHAEQEKLGNVVKNL